MLRQATEMARQEYLVKVGSLFLEADRPDLEIIHVKNLLEQMKCGFTHNQAVKKISKTYYAEQLELEREQEEIHKNEQVYKKREEKDEINTEQNKAIWKRLIAKFHPDLVQDEKEKEKRDAIMKQIN